MDFLKVNSNLNLSTSSQARVKNDEGVLYLKQANSYDNEVGNISQLHFYSKTTNNILDETIATNPKVKNVTATGSPYSASCDYASGSIFNITTSIPASNTLSFTIPHFVKIAGEGVLIRVTVGNNCTVKYGSSTVFTTSTSSDYAAGTYYISLICLADGSNPTVINFFKEP